MRNPKDEGRDLSFNDQEPASGAQQSKDEGVDPPFREQKSPGNSERSTGGASPQDGSLRPRLDFERLRLPPNGGEIGVRKLVSAIVPRKPGRQEFVRVHPTSQFQTALLEIKGERRDVYLLDRSLWDRYPNDLTPVIIYLAITRQGGAFFWPVRVASGGRALDTWNDSAHFAAQQAKSSWVRVSANMDVGHYDVLEAVGDLGEPEWPTRSLEELLDQAFKDRFIADEGHPVLRRLRGETS
jgi:hypothetical protein